MVLNELSGMQQSANRVKRCIYMPFGSRHLNAGQVIG
jgi:hypothetical protein